jgi:hypothetical protein
LLIDEFGIDFYPLDCRGMSGEFSILFQSIGPVVWGFGGSGGSELPVLSRHEFYDPCLAEDNITGTCDLFSGILLFFQGAPNA